MIAAIALLSAGCSRPAPERGPAIEAAPAVERVGPNRDAASAAAPAAPPPVGQAPSSGPGAAAAPQDPAARALERAEILALRPLGDPEDGRFRATLSLGAAVPSRVRLAPAQLQAPLAYRRPLAFYRLARALGARVVPPAAVRRLGIGELAALLEREPAVRGLLQSFAVMNDGTVDTLVSALAPGPRWEAPGGRSIPYAEAPELTTWARWASSAAPVRNERTSLVRDYMEMLMLDYLAGYPRREHVLLDDAAGALILDDNRKAFPLHVRAHELDPLLRRLAASARFPRSLHEALVHFGRNEATTALRAGGFEQALVTPRALVELDERRVALITLIEARISAQGIGITLSL